MILSYLVTNPETDQSVVVELETNDVLTISKHDTTPQIEQICRDHVEESVRTALDEQLGSNLDAIDVGKLQYQPIY